MGFADDERAQAIQIGAIMLFGVLIISFASYQAFVVPNQNRQVEFKHNQQVQQQMQDLRNAIVSIPGGGSGKSVSIDLGTRYPSRMVALNPPPASGTLRTVGTSNQSFNLTIRNATTDGEIGDFWNGSTHTYNTGALVYQPNYNLYSAPTTVYENSVLFNDFTNSALPVTGQQLIDGNRITITTLNGSLSRSQAGATSVDLRPVSSSQTEILVKNSSENINVELPTKLSQDAWKNLTEAEPNVVGVSVSSGALPNGWGLLRIDLRTGVTYNLQLTKVGVGRGVTGRSDAYISSVGERAVTTPSGTNVSLRAVVRDEYNNPITGRLVNATVSGSGDVFPANTTTNSDGEATFTYQPNGAGTATVTMNISSAPAAYEKVRFNVQTYSTGPGTGTGSAPNVTDFNVTDQSSFDWNLRFGWHWSTKYNSAWTVSDDNGDLDTVELRLVRASSNEIRDSVKYDVSGQTASGSTTLTTSGSQNQNYEVEIIAHDKNFHQSECVITDSSDGSGQYSVGDANCSSG
ncbi:MAG: Ig-like domain-containing protein [Haloarculaceae archaeon]